jgi:hypothetical protein
MKSIILILSTSIGAVISSWVDHVGLGGASRANGPSSVRHVCPPGSSATCEGELAPCPGNIQSNPKASVFSNEALYLHWNRNQWPPYKTDQTCIHVGITPFKSNPTFTDFMELKSCIPFSHGSHNLDTDAYVMLPSAIKAGEYTILWLWDMNGVSYASCADITISSVVAPNPSLNPNPLADTHDCKAGRPSPDAYCRAKIGYKSYCRSWSKDSCGNSYCYGDNIPTDGSCGDGVFTIPGRRLFESVNVYNIESTSDGYDKQYTSLGCSGLPQSYCTSIYGHSSTCNVEACGHMICNGDTSYTCA